MMLSSNFAKQSIAQTVLLFLDKAKEKALRIYRKQVFCARIKQKQVCNLKILGKVFVQATDVTIGNNVTIYPNVMFWGDGKIAIGNNVDIGKDTIFYAKAPEGGISIGDYVSIAAQCYIIDSNHGIKKDSLIQRQPMQSKPVIVGKDVWISAGCKIICGAKIHDGCVIGANSLVNSEIEANGVAVGSPAKIIKYRD